MTNNILRLANLELDKKEFFKIFSFSLLLSCIYIIFNLYANNSTTHYEAALEVPRTTQGEIADLYRQSPFKKLRIAFPPGESFSKADFLITAPKSTDTASAETLLLNFLTKYYKTRKPYATFIEPEILQIETDQKEIDTINDEVKVTNINLEILKKKHPNFQPGTFSIVESELLKKEINLLNLEHQLEAIKEKLKSSTIKLIAIKTSNKYTTLVSLIIKAFLIIFASILLQLVFRSVNSKKSQGFKQ